MVFSKDCAQLRLSVLQLFSQAILSDPQVSAKEVITISRHFIDLFGDDSISLLQSDFNKTLQNFKSVSEICETIAQSTTLKERKILFSYLMALVYTDGALEEELNYTKTVASQWQIHTDHSILNALFKNQYEDLSENTGLLTISHPDTEADIPIVGCKGSFAYISHDTLNLLIVLNGQGLTFNHNKIANFTLFPDLTQDDEIDILHSVFSFKISVLKDLLEKKQNMSQSKVTLSTEPELKIIKESDTHSGIQLIHCQNKIQFTKIPSNPDILISGQFVKDIQKSHFFDGEFITVKNVKGSVILSKGDFYTTQASSPKQTILLKEYDRSLPDTAKLHMNYTINGLGAVVTGYKGDIYKNGKITGTSFHISPGDQIRLEHLLINGYSDNNTIQWDIQKIQIESVALEQVNYRYPDSKVNAIQNIDFQSNAGELTAVFGPSGCGKSTLLKTLLGRFKPTSGSVQINGIKEETGLLSIRDYLGYVPQDDILTDVLTVYENCKYAWRLRHPDHHKSPKEIQIHIESVLKQVNLFKKRKSLVGNVQDQHLSGGERKRLNIALELINNPSVIILDEPTTGLSSQDAEEIVQVLRNIANQGRIVIMVIHQPSSSIYEMFDNVVILNKAGNTGTQAYSGNSTTALDLFSETLKDVEEEQRIVRCPTCHFLKPDILMKALKDEAGNYWEMLKIFSKSLYDKNRMPDMVKGEETCLPKKHISLISRFQEAWIQFQRQMLCKWRDKISRIITFLVAPGLGLISSLVLRSAEAGQSYSFADNPMYLQFLFIMSASAIFMGLSVSITELIRDRLMLRRERIANISILGYFSGKLGMLFIYSIIQSLLFLLFAHPVLQIPQMFLVHLFLMTLISLISVALGLLLSSFLKSYAAAYNIVPLIFICQILFSGALPLYKDMNPVLFFGERTETSTPLPAQLMISRWAFEMLVTANISLHPEKQSYLDENREKQEELQNLGTHSALKYEILENISIKYDSLRHTLKQTRNVSLDTLNLYEYKMDGFNSHINFMARDLWDHTFLMPVLHFTWKRNVLILTIFGLIFIGITYIKLLNMKF